METSRFREFLRTFSTRRNATAMARRDPEEENKHDVRPGRHDVAATMNYWDDPGDGLPPTPVVVGKHMVKNERPTVPLEVVVRDITGEEDQYTLDVQGFQLHRHESQFKVFHDEAAIKDGYIAECEELIKQITGAVRVSVYDLKIRQGPSNWHSLGDNNTEYRGPLHRVHIDRSYNGAVARMTYGFPEEAEELLKHRFQIINLWRPIKPILKDPLAVTDARSVPDTDLAPGAILYPGGRRGETFAVRPNPCHRWYFKFGQQPDEPLLVKIYDSDEGVEARRVPHSAFCDPAGEAAPDRESVEVRAFVFY